MRCRRHREVVCGCHRLQGGTVIRIRHRPNLTLSEGPDLLWVSVCQAGREQRWKM